MASGGSAPPLPLDEQRRNNIVSRMPVEATPEDRQRGALLIAASLIAAIRLRGEPITASPKVVAVISDSLKLARMVLQRLNAERQ
jgi:hypothetical protein